MQIRASMKKSNRTTLNKFARHIAQGIREGHACDALIEAISEAGELLAEYYPIQPGDINELSDEIICEERINAINLVYY